MLYTSYTPLRGDYAERRKKYVILFRFSLKMEYPRTYKWNIIEYPRKYDIILHLGLPQEYPDSYSPRRYTPSCLCNHAAHSASVGKRRRDGDSADILFHLGLPQEYPYSYSPRRYTPSCLCNHAADSASVGKRCHDGDSACPRHHALH